jgi:hypothetical protein
MKKKFMTVVAALAVMAVGTTAFAASSPTSIGDAAEAVSTQSVKTNFVKADTTKAADFAKDTTVTDDIGEAYTVKAVSETSILSANRAAKNLLADVEWLAIGLGDGALLDTVKDSTQTVTASVLSVVNISKENTNGASTSIEINNSAIKANGKYVVLHCTGEYETEEYVYENGEYVWKTVKKPNWVRIYPDSVADGKLTITTSDFSVYAVVELSIGDDAAAIDDVTVPAAGTTANGQTTTVSTGAGSSSSSSDSATTSPKTGEY